MKKTRTFLLLLIIFVIISAIFLQFDASAQPAEIGFEQLVSSIENEQVEKITIQNDKVNVTLTDGTEQFLNKEPNESLSTLLSNYAVDTEKVRQVPISVEGQSGFDFFLSSVAPYLFPFLIIGVVLWFFMRQVQGANNKAMMFGQSAAREMNRNKKDKITFKDVAGAKEAKEELMEVVDFLKKPQKYHELGAKPPRGVLLTGSPGTGKTLLAKAVAGEADVPFFSISGSEFVEMFVGVGASRVRDLFKRAKKNTPAIVFVDEIDAVGRQRGAGLGGSHDEREQTLNQILVELDGFDTNTNVIVIAATNRPDILDPALLRPGRFDRQVVIDLPDIKDREEILQVHAKNKPLEKGVDLKRVAQRTPGFSGADLANLLNEAAIWTARNNRKTITQDDILNSIEKVLLGPERRSHVLSDHEKELTAYHEAGHAIVGHFLPLADPVQKVSIISRGRAGGYTLSLPLEDRRLNSKAEFRARLAVMLGGYQAERLIYGDESLTTGASSDLAKVTQLTRSLITDYGMGKDFVPRTFGHKESMIFLGKDIAEHRNYSEKTAEAIDKAMDEFIAEAAETAYNVLKEQKDLLEKVTQALLKDETLEKEAFEEIVGPKPKAKIEKK